MLFTSSSSEKEILSIISKQLLLGSTDARHPFRFVNLCTLDGNQPDSRYVVLREFKEDLALFFYTDSRSEKVAQINKNPNAALLFYHPIERCQVKIDGKAQIITNTELLKEHWNNVQTEAKKGYQSVLAPKTAVSQPEEGWVQELKYQSKNFSIIKVQAKQIECLQLDGEGHLRIGFNKKQDVWQSTWLVP